MIPFPEKKYQIIYADPPWKYRQGKSMGTNFQGAADAHYLTMDYKDICRLPVKEITNNRCILFIWVTFPMLREGLEVITEWGFEYKTIAFSWLKINPIDRKPLFGVGYYTKSNTEVCLLATKGDAHKLVKSNSVSQVIVAPRTNHSEKPIEARKRIIKLVGDLPRIESFARPPKDRLFEDDSYKGWDLWGNEA
jgi:N6-adenosine-specific RNA methylase IME4